MRRLLCVLALLLCATPAYAQNAFDHFDDGAELYFEGEYARSIVEFKRGYSIEPHPMFQVNIALAYWRMDNLDEALEAVRVALADRDRLEPEIIAENQARQHVWRFTQSARSGANAVSEARAAELAAAEAVETDVAAEEVTPTKQSSGPFSALGWAGVGVAAAGTGLLIGWAVMEVGLNDDVEALRAAGEAGDQETYDDLTDDIAAQQRTARILLVSGAGLAVAGAALLIVDLVGGSGESEPAVAVFPTTNGVQVRWRF